MGVLHSDMASIVGLLGKIRDQLERMYEKAEANAPAVSSSGYSQNKLSALVGMFGDLITAAKDMALKDFEEDWTKEVAGNALGHSANKRKRTIDIASHPSNKRRSTPSNSSRYVMNNLS